jgi:hypothetical protein
MKRDARYQGKAANEMSARLVWIATCEVCEITAEFDGSLTVEELGGAARAAGWELPNPGHEPSN